MVKDTALNAIKMGSNVDTIGELAIVADETPKSEATGLTHTPTQAPLLQAEKRIGTTEVILPVIEDAIDFFPVIILFVFLF